MKINKIIVTNNTRSKPTVIPLGESTITIPPGITGEFKEKQDIGCWACGYQNTYGYGFCRVCGKIFLDPI